MSEEFEPVIRKKVKLASSMPAKQYYENQAKHTKSERLFSNIYEARNFQNWIKAVLINQCTTLIRSNLKNKIKLNVFELGCGKGGDLNKWSIANTGVMFGIDISGSSLEEAQKRYQQQTYRFMFHLKQASADQRMLAENFPANVNFDVVSMQFVANLIFSSEEAVDRLLSNVTSRLCNQGYFILTITDANVIVKKMRSLGKRTAEGHYRYDNEHFSIEFDSLEFKGSPYGQQYRFFLEDSVGEKDQHSGHITYVPEYLIEMSEFEKKAKEFDLEIVESLNFTEVYHKYKDQYYDLLKKMMKVQESEWTMKPSHWEISHLYRYVILRHGKGIDQWKVNRREKLLASELPMTKLELDPNL